MSAPPSKPAVCAQTAIHANSTPVHEVMADKDVHNWRCLMTAFAPKTMNFTSDGSFDYVRTFTDEESPGSVQTLGVSKYTRLPFVHARHLQSESMLWRKSSGPPFLWHVEDCARADLPNVKKRMCSRTPGDAEWRRPVQKYKQSDICRKKAPCPRC